MHLLNNRLKCSWRILTQKVNTNDQNLQQFKNIYLQGKCIYFRFYFIPWSVISVLLICGTDHKKYLYKRRIKVSEIELWWAKKCFLHQSLWLEGALHRTVVSKINTTQTKTYNTAKSSLTLKFVQGETDMLLHHRWRQNTSAFKRSLPNNIS